MVAEPTEAGRTAYRVYSGRAARERERSRVYTADEVAAMLGCCAASVRKMAREGRIPHLTIGRSRYRYPKGAIDAWIDAAALKAAGMEEQP